MKKNIPQDYWVYILLCENNSYYTGYTNNLPKRYAEHLNGTGKCKYTRSFKPITIVQCWHIKDSKSLAMQLESKIKRLSKAEKEKVIFTPAMLSQDARVQVIDGASAVKDCRCA